MKILKYFSYLILTLLTFHNFSIAQGFTISNNAVFSLGAATFSLSLNWDDEGTFDAGSGTLLFNKNSGDQTITCPGEDIYYNIEINKTSGNVILQDNITVNNNLTISRGNLNINNNVITLGPSGILSESNSNTIISGTIKTIRSLNAPHNLNVAGLGAEISTTSNLGSTLILRGDMIQTNNGNESIKRFFDIKPANENIVNGELVFHYNQNELNGINESELELFSSVDFGNTWMEIGGTLNARANTVTITGLTHFSRWTLGSSSTPLPVELKNFTALSKDNKIFLNWNTATEVNNYGFEIERKSNLNWENIGFVSGHGNSNSPQKYSYTDKYPTSGNKFKYRLKQIDNDGSFKYSKEVETELTPEEFNLSQNYPNPFNPTTKINFRVPEETNVNIKIFDITGREVKEILNKKEKPGYYSITLNGSELSSGVYFYRMRTSSGYSSVKKLMLLK